MGLDAKTQIQIRSDTGARSPPPPADLEQIPGPCARALGAALVYEIACPAANQPDLLASPSQSSFLNQPLCGAAQELATAAPEPPGHGQTSDKSPPCTQLAKSSKLTGQENADAMPVYLLRAVATVYSRARQPAGGGIHHPARA